MLVKFESKSSSSKAIAFHPRRAWVLVALYSSTIQLWDYRMGTVVDRFEGHEGPVRCVDFHPQQNMFVSCGDDGTVRVWSLQDRRCLFVLNGHFDYVRTAFFHRELPWIISASDDQTIRIWNWQNRSEIACLTGHSHWVSCAKFHPTEDLIVSSSLDMTVRVWDMSALRKKHSAPSDEPFRLQPSQSEDMFAADAVVKYVLEGHDGGVNWADFHPTQPLVISGGDDRTVKVWRTAETRAWELDTCRGHTNNVTCVLFHPQSKLIVSVSDDKTLRTWDLESRALVSTYRRDSDKFWNVSAHPTVNLLGATHDSGVMIFKLARERPAHAITPGGNVLFVTPQKVLKDFDPKDQVDRQGVLTLRKVGTDYSPITELSYNPSERAVLVTSKDSQGASIFALARLPAQPMGPIEPSNVVTGTGDQALFVSRNRFALLNVEKQSLDIRDLENATTKSLTLPIVTKRIITTPTPNHLVLVGAQSVVIFDTQQKRVLHKLAVPGVKYAAWSHDGRYIALQAKHNLTIADSNLKQLSSVYETIRIKSVGWDSHNVVFYTTFNHLKYALLNGDSGVLKSLSQTLYVVNVVGNTVVCLSRSGAAHLIRVDPTEYRFKRALVNKNFKEVSRLIQNSSLVGQSIVAYLQRSGYPEVAMQFVQDPQTKFDLAIECGDLGVAYEQAKILNKPVAYRILGAAALEQGNHDIVEDMYQKQTELDKLGFLYLITGNKSRLQMMEQIAEHRNDPSARFQISLFLNSAESRIQLLRESGMSPLAYALAKSNGLNSLAQEILTESGIDPSSINVPVKNVSEDPVLGVAHETYKSNWPFERKNVTTIVLDGADSGPAEEETAEITDGVNNISVSDKNGDVDAEDGLEADGDDAWGLDELDDGEPLEEEDTKTAAVPAAKSETEVWVQSSHIPAHHVAAGSFETAAQLLNRQIGVQNFAPLKKQFLRIYQASKLFLNAHEGLPPLEFFVRKDATSPYIPGFDSLTALLQEGYKLVKARKLELTIDHFREILYTIILLSVDKKDVKKCQDIIDVCKNYILAFTIEAKRSTLPPSDVKRNLELASYFTVPKLRSAHTPKQYQVAFQAHYKARNFATASHFAAKFLEVEPQGATAAQIRKLKAKCDANPLDEVDINFDAFAEVDICPGTLTPIYGGQPFVVDPLTGAKYHPSEKGKICSITGITQVGAAASGLQLSGN